MLYKISVFKYFAKFTGKHLLQSLLLIKLQVLPCNFTERKESTKGVL